MDLWELILVIAGAGVVLDQIWTKVILRLWRVIHGTIVHIDADRVLMDIARQFKPNAGNSLVDQIRSIEKQIADTAGNLTELANRVDLFIIDQHPGGNRHTDPPEGH
jgi:hypothetical protein